jgi:type IV secretory pathway TrbL component
MTELGPGGGYGPNWGPAPPAPPPANKTNPVVWFGIGCAAFIVVVFGVFAALGLVAWNAAKSGKTVGGAFSAGVKVELDGGVVSIDAGAKTGPPAGSPICRKAAACCKAVFEKAGGNAASLASCENLETGTEPECELALKTYRGTAAGFGAVCP